jgi:iron complex outermembrane receptor protein
MRILGPVSTGLSKEKPKEQLIANGFHFLDRSIRGDNMKLKRAYCAAIAFSVGATLAGMAQAAAPAGAGAGADTVGSADQLEEVVVTAERRAADVQKTAESISVRDGKDLATEGRYELSQILEDVPGVIGGAATSNGAGSAFGSDTSGYGVTIRGIASSVPTAGGVNTIAPATAVYVDGVYEGVGGSYDIDRVEVLRGPQGTLYGRSATSGIVAVHTANPDLNALGGNVSAEAGNYDLQHYEGAVNLPLVDDKLAVRVAGNYYSRNGYYELNYSDHGGEVFNKDGKIKLLFKPTDSFSVLLGAAVEKNILNAVDYNSQLVAPDTIAINPLPAGSPIGLGGNEQREYWADISWDLGFGTVTYEPAFRSFTQQGTFYARNGAAFNFNQYINEPKDHFNTQELRIASDAGSRVTWQAGALYYLNNLSSSDNIITPPGFGNPDGAGPGNAILTSPWTNEDIETPEKYTQAMGIFGELTYPFADSWRVTAGLRYDYTKVVSSTSIYFSLPEVVGGVLIPTPAPVGSSSNSIGGSAGTDYFRNTTYKLRFEHDLTAQNMVYAMYSTGFTPGDLTINKGGTTANPVPQVFPLQSETLNAYEIGSKNRFLGNTLQINGDLYYYYYGGFQLANVNSNNALPGPPSPAPNFIVITSPVEVFGAEIEALYQMTPNDRVGLNLGYTNAYFVGKNSNVINLGGGVTTTFAFFYTLNSVPNVVPFTANLNYDHRFDLPGGSSLTFSADARYLGPNDQAPGGLAATLQSFYPYIRAEGEALGDLNLTWLSSNKKFSVGPYVRNVTNNQYKTVANPPPVPFVPATATRYDPRTYGVVLSARL